MDGWKIQTLHFRGETPNGLQQARQLRPQHLLKYSRALVFNGRNRGFVSKWMRFQTKRVQCNGKLVAFIVAQCVPSGKLT